MRAVSLDRDVLVATSAVLQVNCVIVRGAVAGEDEAQIASGQARAAEEAGGTDGERAGETFVIDSPVLPEELETLPALLEQAHFPKPSGLLATHGDWDHLLGRLAFPVSRSVARRAPPSACGPRRAKPSATCGSSTGTC